MVDIKFYKFKSVKIIMWFKILNNLALHYLDSKNKILMMKWTL